MYLSSFLHFHSRILGIREKAFGSIVLTAVGSMKYKELLAPITPFIHVPVLITIN